MKLFVLIGSFLPPISSVWSRFGANLCFQRQVAIIEERGLDFTWEVLVTRWTSKSWRTINPSNRAYKLGIRSISTLSSTSFSSHCEWKFKIHTSTLLGIDGRHYSTSTLLGIASIRVACMLMRDATAKMNIKHKMMGGRSSKFTYSGGVMRVFGGRNSAMGEAQDFFFKTPLSNVQA